MPTRLILIRHGQTSWSLKKRYCSFSDIDINNKGKKQAEKLRQRLNKEKIYRVYSNDSKRALNFAKIALGSSPLRKVPQLREVNFGIFEGLTYTEIMKKYPKIYMRWLKNPFNVNIPEGENLRDFKKRVMKIFKTIVSLNKNKTVAIVTHAGPIKIIINNILKPKNIWKINSDLASINIIELKNGKTKIELLNNTSYLKNG